MNGSATAPGLTGMADAVMNEIASLAAKHCTDGGSAAIELTSMPLTAQDRAEIEARLGRGEVEATVEAAGRSEVWETTYAGVWFVRHLGLDGEVANEMVEICLAPLILFSHPDDRRAAAARLGEDLRAKAAPAV
jgi:HupH hydrogenase expression protein, C-terminal conserved region